MILSYCCFCLSLPFSETNNKKRERNEVSINILVCCFHVVSFNMFFLSSVFPENSGCFFRENYFISVYFHWELCKMSNAFSFCDNMLQ